MRKNGTYYNFLKGCVTVILKRCDFSVQHNTDPSQNKQEKSKEYSWVSNTRGGSNKRVGWNFSSNLISGEALITAGRVEIFFICVGEKTGRLEIFLKINKRGGSNNSG